MAWYGVYDHDGHGVTMDVGPNPTRIITIAFTEDQRMESSRAGGNGR